MSRTLSLFLSLSLSFESHTLCLGIFDSRGERIEAQQMMRFDRKRVFGSRSLKIIRIYLRREGVEKN